MPKFILSNILKPAFGIPLDVLMTINLPLTDRTKKMINAGLIYLDDDNDN